MTDKLLISRPLLQELADQARGWAETDALAILAQPSAPAGEAVEVVAYMDHHDTLSHDAPRTAHFALMTVAQHQRILAQRDAKLDGVVEVLRSKFPLIDPNKPYPIDENLHHIEWHLMRERERLHKTIDAALAAAGVGDE